MILVDDTVMNALGESTSNAKSKNGRYYAMVEVFHQLHCLNLIRKYTWRHLYRDDKSFQTTRGYLWEHVGKDSVLP